ncbi:MmyB family transcriptional regulator [Actinacidiphila yanglinensis]|nr:helix-turn-helix domain-containing protein [Actinacidiphila yanglinensis]
MRILLARARARQDPGALGLTPRAEPRGRKVAGLTHEHMTRLLGWPEHKYGYVERGRLATIDAEVLEPIARTLRLTEQEWEALVLYATGAPPAFPLDPEVGRVVPRPWRRVLAGTPEIAYVSDAAWDLVAYNSAFARLFGRQGVPGNIMRWMLLDARAREILVDWENSWLSLLVPQLRAGITARPADPTLRRLLADLRRDPVVGPRYDSPTTEYVQPRAEGARPLLHPELGPGWATMCAAGPFGVPGGRLMFVLFDQGERPVPQPPMQAPATGPVDPDPDPARASGSDVPGPDIEPPTDPRTAPSEAT